jgi:hypothetical protein
VNDAVIAHLATTVDQTPLRIEDRRLLLTGIQSGDGQQHLHIRGKPVWRCQHHTLAVQMTRHLTHQQLVDIRRKAARPATIGRSLQAAVG